MPGTGRPSQASPGPAHGVREVGFPGVRSPCQAWHRAGALPVTGPQDPGHLLSHKRSRHPDTSARLPSFRAPAPAPQPRLGWGPGPQGARADGPSRPPAKERRAQAPGGLAVQGLAGRPRTGCLSSRQVWRPVPSEAPCPPGPAPQIRASSLSPAGGAKSQVQASPPS